MEEPEWQWSDAHKNYYKAYRDPNEKSGWRYIWATQPAQEEQTKNLRHDSLHSLEAVLPQGDAQALLTNNVNTYNVAQPTARQSAIATPRPIAGRSTENSFETLDPSYKVRDSRFFKQGRVFSVLFTEACGDTLPPDNQTSVTVVRFGERVFSQIRRFVVVKEGRGFCNACPIFTYSSRGTTKPGLDPNAHAIIYTSGRQPTLLSGEHGMTKQPIAVRSIEGQDPLNRASRINFGLCYPIQHNVKVKNLGMIERNDIDIVAAYWRIERDRK